MSRSRAITSFLMLMLWGSTPLLAQPSAEAAGDGACIRWEVSGGQEVNKSQAERLYWEAYRWVEDHVAQRKDSERPCISVIVGKACPDASHKGPCLNPVTGTIFVPKWKSNSPGIIVEGTIRTMLLYLLDSKEITQAAQNMLDEDSNTFLDFIPKQRPR